MSEPTRNHQDAALADRPAQVRTVGRRRPPQAKEAWHAMSVDDVAGRLGADPSQGLTPHQTRKRRERFGLNELRPPEAIAWWEILAEQFKSIVVVLLIVAAGVALAMGEWVEGLSVVAVILLNAGIGFLTEFRANKAMEALQKLGVAEATVLRGGKRKTVSAADLVPGDVIVLQEGDRVPADARVIESAELRVEEASLTGEPESVRKVADLLDDEHLPLADRRNMVYKSTSVTTGNAVALVVNTGMNTEIGRVSELVSGVEEGQTPLQRRLDRLGRKLIVVCLVVAGLVFFAGLLQGMHWSVMLRAAIALAVAAVPEGLPAVATITLAVGMKRMAERNALIRSLPTVETLGSATCVCTDKTGTLTRGEMTAGRLALPDREYRVTGGGYEPAGEFHEATGGDQAPSAGGPDPGQGQAVDPLEDARLRALLTVGVLCNNATLERTDEGGWTINGDTTEGALTVTAAKAGLDAEPTRARHEELAELPFTSDVMMMATTHAALAEDFTDGDGRMLCVKGAPARVLEHCTRALTPEGPAELTDDARRSLAEQNERLAGQGLRMLAAAYRPVDEPPADHDDAYRDLTWVGLFGIVDPPRDEARQTVDVLTGAGVKTVMITGDQPATARRIAEQLHVAPEGAEVLTGRDLAGADAEAMAAHVAKVEVFARVSPEQKVQIASALQEGGDIVAMLGDGVNDAIALKQADIGVAMGIKGTDVAKETADMLLLDDRFATVAGAMEQGRIIYDNIKKFIHYLFSCNLSEILTMLIASVAASLTGGWVSPLPLLPLQILWLNIVTDVFPALSLAMEPGEADVMNRPPRDPSSGLLDRATLTSVGGFALLITLATVTAFLIGTAMYGTPVHHDPHGGGDAGVASEPSKAITMSFMTIALAQLFHVFNSRKERKPMRRGEWMTNRYVLGAIVLVVALQLLAVYAPFMQPVLDTAPLGIVDWLIVAALSLAPLAIGQAYRWARAGRTP